MHFCLQDYKREIVSHLLTEYAAQGIVTKTPNYGFKFVSDAEAEEVLQKKTQSATHGSKEAYHSKTADKKEQVPANQIKRPDEEQGAPFAAPLVQTKPIFDNSAVDEHDMKTIERLADLPLTEAVRLAIKYKLLDHLPDLEGPTTKNTEDDVRLALRYTLYDHPPLGNRDASRNVGPAATGYPPVEEQE